MHSEERMQSAYTAACQALAAMGVRNLLAIESDEPAVASVDVRAGLDGSVDVTLRDEQGRAVGGYSL